MLDFAALDVALGLIFVYLVLSLVCTAVNETVSSVLAWRADTLREGIRNLLGGADAQEALYRHPLVRGLIRPARRRWQRGDRYPSYIPARVFATALLNPVGKDGPTRPSVPELLKQIDNRQVRNALEVIWNDSGHRVEAFRAGLETWFDESMSRVSGWYRRRVQVWLWVWALGVTFSLHVDSIEIARKLWTDDATRSVVVARAERAAQAPLTEASLQTAADSVDELEQLEIPIGWAGSFPEGGFWDGVLVIFANALGLGMTAVALTLGAPFWFDLLKKVANIRAAGKAPSERPVEKPAEAGEPAVPERGG